MSAKINKILLSAAACLAMTLVVSTRQAGAQDVTTEQVSNAIQQGTGYLKANTDPFLVKGNFEIKGTLALEVLALINAGVPIDDPTVKSGLETIASLPNEYTYVVGLKIQALAAADPKKYSKEIDASAKWLIENQSESGMWTYNARRMRGGRISNGGGDNSNTQFALLGLHEAAKAGATIPEEVWKRSRNHFTNSQCTDGGWAYTGTARSGAYGSMTAAGIASLYICGQRLMVGGDKTFANGVYPDCGKYQQNVVLAKGLEWMAKKFSVRENPGRGTGWLYYYLYAMERVGMVSGLRNIGTNDWYRQGAAYLVSTQKRDGSWGSPIDTSFAVLFLAKGNRPVLIQKLAWNDKSGKPGMWNRNIHDLENFTVFIGDKLGKPVTWQTTSLDMSVQELRVSPILFITGHDFPVFTDPQKEKLRQYVESGGTLVFDACCGQESFRVGCREFAKQVFKDYTLRKLGQEHPVFNSLYQLKGDDMYDLEGIDIGCRTGVFFSPHALSSLWELQTIPTLSDRAYKIGVNIAAYATGKEQLGNKLDVVELPEAAKAATQPAQSPRGAVRIARLWHDGGDYNADPHMLLNLAGQLRDKAKIDVVAKDEQLKATDVKIFDYPVVFMTGHYKFNLSDKEIEALRKYLDRGGCLVADSCCGMPAFDEAFRQMVRQLYPDAELKPLAADHPLYTGGVGIQLSELKYRKKLADELGQRGTNKPPLEAVVVKGRTVILYSKYDFTCALEGDNPFACRGYIDADGQKLALNLFLYAISY